MDEDLFLLLLFIDVLKKKEKSVRFYQERYSL
jgi:hypothetical protein